VVKIGARVITYARHTAFQLAGVAVSRGLFCRILEMINELRPRRMAQAHRDANLPNEQARRGYVQSADGKRFSVAAARRAALKDPMSAYLLVSYIFRYIDGSLKTWRSH
jgi:hypothetical protein